MTSGSGPHVHGVLLRRADTLYFIPDQQLEGFRVPGDVAHQANRMAEEESEVAAHGDTDAETQVVGELTVRSAMGAEGTGSMW
jgi:hypothetical protein